MIRLTSRESRFLFGLLATLSVAEASNSTQNSKSCILPHYSLFPGKTQASPSILINRCSQPVTIQLLSISTSGAILKSRWANLPGASYGSSENILTVENGYLLGAVTPQDVTTSIDACQTDSSASVNCNQLGSRSSPINAHNALQFKPSCIMSPWRSQASGGVYESTWVKLSGAATGASGNVRSATPSKLYWQRASGGAAISC